MHLKAVREQQKGKPRYLPEKDEFLRYFDVLYIEPKKPFDDLKAYILKNKMRTEEQDAIINGDLMYLHGMIQDREEPTEFIQYFVDEGYPLHGIDKLNAFMQKVMEAHNNTRMFENNGFTPNELSKVYAKQRPKEPILHIPKKVGRNEPCPCGSGKKYKKCCAVAAVSQSAQLSHSERKLFYETWYKLLDYANRKLKVVDYKFSLSYPNYHDETLLLKIRDRLWKEPKLIGKFIANTDGLSGEEVKLLQSWEKNHVKGQFALIKYLPDAAVFMRMEKGETDKLYAVKGMTTSIAEAMQRKLPVMLETVLLPFGDKIIYDSFMGSHDIEFGGNVMEMFEREYAEAKHGIITKL